MVEFRKYLVGIIFWNLVWKKKLLSKEMSKEFSFGGWFGISYFWNYSIKIVLVFLLYRAQNSQVVYLDSNAEFRRALEELQNGSEGFQSRSTVLQNASLQVLTYSAMLLIAFWSSEFIPRSSTMPPR